MRGRLNAIIGMAILTIPIFYVALSILTKKEPAIPTSGDRVQIRWFVGLEIDSDLKQIAVLEDVAAEFNTIQDEIELVLDIATIDGAYDMFSTQISTGYGPDIVGPISWGTAMGFPVNGSFSTFTSMLPNQNLTAVASCKWVSTCKGKVPRPSLHFLARPKFMQATGKAIMFQRFRKIGVQAGSDGTRAFGGNGRLWPPAHWQTPMNLVGTIL
jgi:hypothetical protein